MNKILSRRDRFVVEYLIDRNATQAAIRAGYGKRSAHAQGHFLLKVPEIRQAIAEEERMRSERVHVTADQVLADLDRRGKLAEAAGQYAAAIRASELQGKHLGMFNERAGHELVGPDGGPIPFVISRPIMPPDEPPALPAASTPGDSEWRERGGP